jgi:hypothetical protein
MSLKFHFIFLSFHCSSGRSQNLSHVNFPATPASLPFPSLIKFSSFDSSLACLSTNPRPNQRLNGAFSPRGNFYSQRARSFVGLYLSECCTAATLAVSIMMSRLPEISVTPVAQHPGYAFFASECSRVATKLIGVYDFPRDFQLALVPLTTIGNSCVYKCNSTWEPFRTFLLGRIESSEMLLGEKNSVLSSIVMADSRLLKSQQPPAEIAIRRLRVKMMHNATDKAKTLFAEDVRMLEQVIGHELSKVRRPLLPPVHFLTRLSSIPRCLKVG